METATVKDQTKKTAQAGQAPPLQAAADRRMAVGASAGLPLFMQAGMCIQPKLQVSQPGDPDEQEADQVADQVMRMAEPGPIRSSPGVLQRKCPACEASGATCPKCEVEEKAQRKEKSGYTTQASTAVQSQIAGLRGGGQPLASSTRAFFEPRFGQNFSGVRVHTDNEAAEAIQARAFTLGQDVVFGEGEYQPHTDSGRLLLAHELAHVLQRSDGNVATLRRQPMSPQDQTQQGAARTPSTDPANPTVLNLTGPLDARSASFKQLVKTTAVHRLIANQRNLGMWALAVDQVIPAQDIAALGMLQNGASRPYFELQDIQDPGVRELRANQAFGRYRACTGCHIENQLWGTRSQREAESLSGWASPNEIRAGIRPRSRFDAFPSGRLTSAEIATFISAASGNNASATAPSGTITTPSIGTSAAPSAGGIYRPPTGSTEARLNQLFPDPLATRTALNRIGPIMQALGPQGYKVLPGTILGSLETNTPDAVRNQILDAISQRHSDFAALIRKIEANEIGYEHFGPVIRSLLPFADAEVRSAIQREMDDNAFWDKVEAIVVGILSVAALLLTIFPPTSLLGIAALAALDVTLGVYSVNKGEEMMRIGSAYSLAPGAHDVLTPDQQAAGPTMVLNGFISIATGFLGIRSGFSRMDAALTRFGAVGEASTALTTSTTTTAAHTFQQGEYVVTLAEDGAMFVTVASRPDLVIMVRGNTATLYQLLEGGGMRVAATATMPSRATTAAPLMLTAGGDASAASTALVPFGGRAFSGSLPLAPFGSNPLLASGVAPIGAGRNMSLLPGAQSLANEQGPLLLSSSSPVFAVGGTSLGPGRFSPNLYNPCGRGDNCGFTSIAYGLQYQQPGLFRNADILYMEQLQRLGILPTETLSRQLVFPRASYEGLRSRPGYGPLFNDDGHRLNDYTILSVAQSSGLRATNRTDLITDWRTAFGSGSSVEEAIAARLEFLEQAGRRSLPSEAALERLILGQREQLPGTYIIGSRGSAHYMTMRIEPDGTIIGFDPQNLDEYRGLQAILGRMEGLDLTVRVAPPTTPVSNP